MDVLLVYVLIDADQHRIFHLLLRWNVFFSRNTANCDGDADRTTAGTCKACVANTYAGTDAENCVSNTVCGNLAAGGSRDVGDADRTTAGTCK